MMRCSQCGRPAMYDIGGHLLCLEHYTMVTQNAQAAMAASAAMINYLGDSIDRTFGVPPRGPRIQIPQPVVNNMPVTYHNIRVDRSVVGSINTGQVARIDVAMDKIQNNGAGDVGQAVKALTEAVIASNEIDKAEKDELIEYLSFLAEQAALPKTAQQPTIIKGVLKAIPALVTTVASLSALWAQYEPLFEALFKR